MEITQQHEDFRPLGGRTPGGADFPVAVEETLPGLPAPGDDVVVGVIDTGVVVEGGGNHPWFAGHVDLVGGLRDVLREGDQAADGFLAAADGHGTFVSGLILAEAPTVRIQMHGVLDQRAELTDADDVLVIEALTTLAEVPGLQVVNLSFGGGSFRTEPATKDLEQALESLSAKGVAVVAAAGNDGDGTVVWPAAYPGVVGVGALDDRLVLPPGATPPIASFSNVNEFVCAYAEGVQVLGPFVWHPERGGQYPRPLGADRWAEGQRPAQDFRGWARWSGTSFAAAIVSGRIAQYAIANKCTGIEARDALLHDAPIVNGDGRWIRRGQNSGFTG